MAYSYDKKSDSENLLKLYERYVAQTATANQMASLTYGNGTLTTTTSSTTPNINVWANGGLVGINTFQPGSIYGVRSGGNIANLSPFNTYEDENITEKPPRNISAKALTAHIDSLLGQIKKLKTA